MGEDRKAEETRASPASPAPEAGDPALLLRASLLASVRPAAVASARDDAKAGDLLTVAGEDLEAPLAALLQQITRLRRGAGPALPAAAQRALASMDRQARRVAAVAEALGALGALQEGRVELRRAPVDLRAVVARAVEATRADAAARGIEIAQDLAPEALVVPADPDRVQEVVEALLASALAVTPRGARVRVAAEPAADGARVVVEDGHASPPHLARRLARPAERLAGLGLAVAVCRGLAELHGGALDVHASATGRSARLTLPAAPAAAEAIPAAAALPGLPRLEPDAGGKARVLVVDDDADAREALAMTLADDYEVQLASDGQEALDAALADRPELVLMDLIMPRLDGMAALEALRADPRTADVPVIFISGRGDEVTRSRTLDLGAVDFLQKPFSGRELRSRIERTLRSSRRETHLQALARTDPLTGLANVRAFRARLEEEVKRARRYRTPLACVMVDMDRLKPINDELGHTAGDVAIAAMAELIRRELRETDFGARYGGDEFVVLLPHTGAADARVFAERVRARLRESQVYVRGQRLPLAASFGISALPEDGDDGGDLLVRTADAALYAAKRAGRGGVVDDGALRDGEAAPP